MRMEPVSRRRFVGMAVAGLAAMAGVPSLVACGPKKIAVLEGTTWFHVGNDTSVSPNDYKVHVLAFDEGSTFRFSQSNSIDMSTVDLDHFDWTTCRTTPYWGGEWTREGDAVDLNGLDKATAKLQVVDGEEVLTVKGFASSQDGHYYSNLTRAGEVAVKEYRDKN